MRNIRSVTPNKLSHFIRNPICQQFPTLETYIYGYTRNSPSIPKDKTRKTQRQEEMAGGTEMLHKRKEEKLSSNRRKKDLKVFLFVVSSTYVTCLCPFILFYSILKSATINEHFLDIYNFYKYSMDLLLKSSQSQMEFQFSTYICISTHVCNLKFFFDTLFCVKFLLLITILFFSYISIEILFLRILGVFLVEILKDKYITTLVW